MAQFGSNLSIGAQNRSAVTDSNGNLIVSPDDGFGGSPLGVAARTQALYGIPNANFDILPPDPYTAITVANQLPYWDVSVDGLGTATMSYDDTTQSWAVRLDPTAGTGAGETITLKTRTYLLNDSNLTLRQKAFLSLTKVGTQATSEWDVVLGATYYSEAGVQLSTYNIGTANSGSVFTTINGFTTSGTAAIDPAAHYADLSITLTTSGSVAGTALVDLNSLLIQTSTGGGGGAQSFLLTQTFTSSGTFTVPTGVDYVTVVAVGAGQGGGGGGNAVGRSTSAVLNAKGGDGGATGYYALVRDIYVGNVGTAGISVGIGAGGTGGTAFAFNKAAAATGTDSNSPTAGASGGNTTFGTYLTVSGARTAPSGFFDIASAAGATGGQGGGATGGPGSAAGAGGIGGTHIIGSTNNGAPFIAFWAGGVAGGTATGSGGTGASGNGGAAGTALAIAGGGGGGGGAAANANILSAIASVGGIGGPGGGASGGGASARYATTTATIVATAGAGATAAANTGAGGGGGGACAVAFVGTATYNPSTLTTTSGAGGNGGSGLLKVIYVG
jgi:hypothetical protein